MKRLRSTIFCLSSVLLILSTKVFADSQNYYPQDFVKSIGTGSLKDQVLKDALFKIVSQAHVQQQGKTDELIATCQVAPQGTKCEEHHSLGYDGARKVIFRKLFLEEINGQFGVTDVYCQKRFTDADFGGQPTFGPSADIPPGTVINTEHTWPQSRFTGRFSKDMQKSDLHHLYPSDTKMNSSRSSLHFGEVSQLADNLNCNTAKLGHQLGGSQIVFEPPHVHKGNVARSLFYFAIRYQMKISPNEASDLRNWHREDPPDEAEKKRNDMIEQIQGNRNPFIDYPLLVEEINSF